MSVSRLVRALHTSVPRLETAASSVVGISSTSADVPAPAPRQFTPKGSPIPLRPKRTTRVTLPSGFPEPPSYPPPKEYFAELDEITNNLPADQDKPKRHPLWGFFHVPVAATKRLSPTTTSPPDCGSTERLDEEFSSQKSGRSWSAVELRQKSFEDLHTLWYVLLRERNVLATQREERRRLGISSAYGGELLTQRAFRCRKSMARIKYVLNERRLGVMAAAAPAHGLPEGVVVPFSVPGFNDPAAAVEALAGQAKIPDIGKMMGRKKSETVLRKIARERAEGKAKQEGPSTKAKETKA